MLRWMHINIGPGNLAAHYLVDVSKTKDGSVQRLVRSFVLIDDGHTGQAGTGADATDASLKGSTTYTFSTRVKITGTCRVLIPSLSLIGMARKRLRETQTR